MFRHPIRRSLYAPLIVCSALPLMAADKPEIIQTQGQVTVVAVDAEPVQSTPRQAIIVAVDEAGAINASIAMKKVAYLGVSTSPVSSQLASHLKLQEGFGLVVDHVQAQEPAEKAGLKANDVIVRMGDQKLVNTMQLGTLVRAQKPGDVIDLVIIREGKEMPIKATLVEKEVPAVELMPFPPEMIFRGDEGQPPRIKWLARGEPGVKWEQHIIQGSARFADEEHQLEIRNDKDGKTLIVKDKEGKELFNGPINTPDQRKAVPEAIQPKLEKLEKSTRVQIQRLPQGVFPGGLPGVDVDFDFQIQGPLEGQRIKEIIEKQLQGLPVQGEQAEELQKRIEEMKKQVDEMMQKARQQQKDIQGRIQRGELPQAVPGGPGITLRHEARQSESVAKMNDGSHIITLKSSEAGRHLTISDQAGRELFNGPINTPEERAKVPQELQGKVDQLEKSVKLDITGSDRK